MKPVLQLIFLLLISFGSLSYGHAAPVVTYEVAPILTMTGENSDVFFSVKDDIINAGTSVGGPELETTSRNFRGAFYIKNAGWVMMQTGSYQVSLDCGAQSINNLSSDCSLTGSGWSELMGEVGFQGVIYKESEGVLSGNVKTFFGEFSVDGISLPILPAEITESLAQLETNHITSLTIKDVGRYGDGPWSINIRPISQAYSQDYMLSNIDLSYASVYEFSVTDPQGSKTRFSGVEVIASGISESLEGGTFFIANFCNIYPAVCPDGNIQSSSTIAKNIPVSPIADGDVAHNFSIKLRDTYGNTLSTGTLDISYSGTVSAVQIESADTSPYAGLENLHDALIFSGALFINDFSGGWNFRENIFGQNIAYGISSIAPTDGTRNTVSLNHIEYTAPSGTKTALFDVTPIVFTPAFTSSIALPDVFEIGKSYSMSGSATRNTLKPFPVSNIFTFLIGNGILAQFENLASDSGNICSSPAYLGECDWYMGGTRPSVIALNLADTFTLSGTYTPKTAYPIREDVRYTSYIQYSTTDNLGAPINVLYPSSYGTKGSQYRESRIKILGQNNALGEYGTVGTDKKIKQTFLSKVRKNIAILSRNRTDYTGAPYSISESDTIVTNASFANKRSIIVVGADIRISENIVRRDTPTTIVALADNNGNGGNIIIDGTVTDIESSLVADHAIMTSGTKQLYIFGSVISSNTLGETAARICPYYINVPCTESEAQKYDLEEVRKGYSGSGDTAISPSAQKYPQHALIIEYDIRVQSDPPPAIQ